MAVNTDGLKGRCEQPASDAPVSGSDECIWWRFVRRVGEDIWRTAEAFAKTSTLDDTIAPDQAAAVYRMGQYLALLNAPQIRRSLDVAAQRRAARAAH